MNETTQILEQLARWGETLQAQMRSLTATVASLNVESVKQQQVLEGVRADIAEAKVDRHDTDKRLRAVEVAASEVPRRLAALEAADSDLAKSVNELQQHRARGQMAIGVVSALGAAGLSFVAQLLLRGKP